MNDYDEIERNIIGAYIENEDLFSKFPYPISEKLFSGKAHKLAFKYIRSMYGVNKKVDGVLIGRELMSKGISQVPSYTFNANYRRDPESYIGILFERNVGTYLLPKLTDACVKLQTNKGSPMDIFADVKSTINELDLVINNVAKDKPISDIIDKAIEEVVEANMSKEVSRYTSTIERLDNITGGLLPGIIVIGALPGMGKTSLLVNIIVENAINNKFPIVFFSLEMSATQVIKNIAANYYELDTMKIRDGNLDDEQLFKFKQAKHLIKDNLIIDDTPGVTWQYIDAKLSKVRKKVPFNQQLIVMVDYLQQMGNTEEEIKGKTDEAQMAQRCKGLMNLWKKHNACIIELSQLGREVAKEKRRPRMSDLKESGAIEANANSVWLLHCPDYFEKNPTDGNGRDLNNLAEIIVDKNRGGRKGAAYTNFIKKYSKFTNLTKEDWEKRRSGII